MIVKAVKENLMVIGSVGYEYHFPVMFAKLFCSFPEILHLHNNVFKKIVSCLHCPKCIHFA